MLLCSESGLDGLGRREREDLRVVTAVGLRDKTRRARSSLTKDGEERKVRRLSNCRSRFT